jgi:hypothetical protein
MQTAVGWVDLQNPSQLVLGCVYNGSLSFRVQQSHPPQVTLKMATLNEVGRHGLFKEMSVHVRRKVGGDEHGRVPDGQRRPLQPR